MHVKHVDVVVVVVVVVVFIVADVNVVVEAVVVKFFFQCNSVSKVVFVVFVVSVVVGVVRKSAGDCQVVPVVVIIAADVNRYLVRKDFAGVRKKVGVGC